MPAMTAVAMSQAPRDRVGLASGVFNASRQTGGALGVAVLGALLAGGSGHVSLHAAFLATAGAYVGGIALALTGRRRARRITAVHVTTQSPPPTVRAHSCPACSRPQSRRVGRDLRRTVRALIVSRCGSCAGTHVARSRSVGSWAVWVSVSAFSRSASTVGRSSSARVTSDQHQSGVGRVPVGSGDPAAAIPGDAWAIAAPARSAFGSGRGIRGP